MIYITRLRRAWSIKRSLDPRGKLSHSSGVWSMAVRKIIENKIVKTVPPLCDKIFNNVDKDKYIDEQNCTGRKCIECLTCYTDSPINVIVEGVK